MKKRLTKAFFDRDTLLVTEELLGKFLVQKTDTGEMASMIIEVEAYDGPLDKASHASRGKTMRNAVNADRDTDGNFLIVGESTAVDLDPDEVVVTPGAMCMVEGWEHSVADLQQH